MINTARESILPVSEAIRAGWFGPPRRGKKLAFSTVYRWILDGARGPDGSRVRLEAVRLGGAWHVSRAAIQRFAEALTPHLTENSVGRPRTPNQRHRASEAAARELDQLGIRSGPREGEGEVCHD